MNFYPKRALCVLDPGPDSVVCMIAQSLPGDGFRVLGMGESPVQGFENSEITHLGDAVEAVASSVRAAEQAAGVRAETLYYNFKDVRMRSLRPCVSKSLNGEGEIRRTDVEETRKLAERMVSDFESTIVYSKPVSFLIDDRDSMMDPVGVFGRKMDVCVHVLQARSSVCESWQKLFERAHFGKAVRVLSALSICQGIFPKPAAHEARLVIDCGRDAANVFLVENGGLSDFAAAPTGGRWEVAAELAGSILEKRSARPGVWVTGGFADDERLVKAFGEYLKCEPHVGRPLGVAAITEARHAPLAGLLRIAEAHDRRASVIRHNRGILDNVKEKAVSLVHEYF